MRRAGGSLRSALAEQATYDDPFVLYLENRNADAVRFFGRRRTELAHACWEGKARYVSAARSLMS